MYFDTPVFLLRVSCIVVAHFSPNASSRDPRLLAFNRLLSYRSLDPFPVTCGGRAMKIAGYIYMCVSSLTRTGPLNFSP